MAEIRVSNFLVLLHLYCCCCCFRFGTAAGADTIRSSQSIKDPEAVTSNNGAFRLGFFSLANSTDRYVGIWYIHKGIPEETIIWTANRNRPLKDDSGLIMISEDGNLVVSNGQNEILWSSNVRNQTAPLNATAKVLDSGNLVLQDNTAADGVILWESFKEPSNVFMPSMTISKNVRTGETVQLTSWKSSSDPSNGSFAFGLEPLNIPQVFIWNNKKPYWRSGPWNGQIFTGLLNMHSSVVEGISIADDNEGTFYCTSSFANNSYPYNFILYPQGILVERDWNDEKGEWDSSPVSDTECGFYGKCGTFGSCDSQKSPICSCLRGFEPKNRDQWNRGNWTSGCVRMKPLQCLQTNNGSESGKEDGFLKLESVKVPDFAEWLGRDKDNCKEQCLNKCSCIAYAYDPGIGCMSWSKDLIDIQKFSSGGTDLYIRLAASELDKKSNITMIIIITVLIGTFIIIAISIFLVMRRKANDKAMTEKSEERLLFHKGGALAKFSGSDMLEDKDIKLHQLPLFKFEELAAATANFKHSNKLGEGGFGPVYKGILKDGKEIAVKRLSRASGQGFEELTNEVLVISKLQHRNLVRLWGCCIEREEKMLVYEYMPNKSLDAFLFDPTKQKLLDWKKRFDIIQGISRGLLYLHRDSRLRIIHRDLKSSNILLDEEMNPKISDFGMARIFGGNENQANTRRVVGTYGYMAPEYAMSGKFSEKSDVFSFGVLLLEIISGRRNTSFNDNDPSSSLLGYAWKLWTEDNILALTDTAVVSDQCYVQEILRCIHVGLLCVQEFAEDRPSISTVISMLNSEIVDIPTPLRPAFTGRQNAIDRESQQNNENICSLNDVTITNIKGR